MRYFFEDESRFESLLAELESWAGTPFMPGAAVKGGGVDCVRFVHEVYVAVGAITPAAFPSDYVVRGGGRAMLEILEARIASVPQLERVWHRGGEAVPICRGDMMLGSTGDAWHHLAIVARPPVMWHCLKKVGQGNIHDPALARRLWSVYRVR